VAKNPVEDGNSRWIPKVSLLALILISYITFPNPMQPKGAPTVYHVWYYGWMTALSTGLGVLPFMFVPDLDKYWIGVSNAVAAGMMIAASYSLLLEGITFEDPLDTSSLSTLQRTTFGAIVGLIFIHLSTIFLDAHDDLKLGALQNADAKKVLLIMFVMTLHSLSEGIGIGASFAGIHGSELGLFISTSLAVHNIPEGLAVAIVLLPRKVPKLNAFLLCILTSIPQPIMAVPAFLFVNQFIPFLPCGLGFAGGAMAWVACFELLSEAKEDTNFLTTAVVSSISLWFMMIMQNFIEVGTR